MGSFSGPAEIVAAAEAQGLSVPEAEYQSNVLGWAQLAIQDGETFLRSQAGYAKIDETIKSINGEQLNALRSETLSVASSNLISKIALDLTAGLTDTKPFWEYRHQNKRFEATSQLLGKLALHFWLNRFADIRFADAIKYSLVGGTGWTHHIYDPTADDIDIIAEDPRDVLPIRPAGNYSIQDAFGVIIRRERPVNYVKARYPRVANLIKADRDTSFATQQQASRVGRLLSALGMSQSPFHAAVFANRPAANLPMPVVDVYVLYVRDGSVNKTSREVKVGEFYDDGSPKNTWSYTVPPKQPLYPRGRCIQFTRTAILYDGPNIYWHGMFPVNKLTLDPWPWTWLGKAPLWDLLPLQQVRDRLLRGVDDHAAQAFRPAVVTDKNATSKATLDKLDTRRAGWKLSHNPIAGKGPQIVYPQALDPVVQWAVGLFKDEMEYVSGVRDLMNFTRLGQIPSSETIEKIMESLSPAIRLRSRVLEAFLREFAMMVASNFMQFYTLPRRLAIAGPDALTFEDFDFDPGTLVPDFVHPDDLSSDGSPTAQARQRGPRPRYERARQFLSTFTFHIAPGSLLSASEVSRKLMYLQLARAGWIDLWTLLDVLGVPGVGDPPEGADTIPKRLAAMAQLGLGMSVNPAGRKASGQELPRQVVKES